MKSDKDIIQIEKCEYSTKLNSSDCIYKNSQRLNYDSVSDYKVTKISKKEFNNKYI